MSRTRRKWRTTAAERRCSGEDSGQPEGEFRREKRGNERGNDGLLIGQKKERNRGVNRWQSRGGNLVWDERVQRLEEDDDDVIADVTVGPTC